MRIVGVAVKYGMKIKQAKLLNITKTFIVVKQ